MTQPHDEDLEAARDQREGWNSHDYLKSMLGHGVNKNCPECRRQNDRFWTCYFAADAARIAIDKVIDKGEFSNQSFDDMLQIASDLYDGMCGRKKVDN